MNLVCELNFVDLIELFYFIKRKGWCLFGGCVCVYAFVYSENDLKLTYIH